MTQRVLVRLSRINPTAVFLAVGAFVFLALVLPGLIGGVLLLTLAAGVGWILARTWHTHPAKGRTARLLVLALLVAVAAYRATS